MLVYNYENLTHRVSGMSVINDPKGTKQEGILLHLRRTLENDPLVEQKYTIFLDKRECAHISKMTKTGRKFWTRFRLPKMITQ